MFFLLSYLTGRIRIVFNYYWYFLIVFYLYVFLQALKYHISIFLYLFSYVISDFVISMIFSDSKALKPIVISCYLKSLSYFDEFNFRSRRSNISEDSKIRNCSLRPRRTEQSLKRWCISSSSSKQHLQDHIHHAITPTTSLIERRQVLQVSIILECFSTVRRDFCPLNLTSLCL